MKEKVQPNSATSPWRTERIGPSAVIHVREIDPKIQARMPIETRTFMDVGPIELAITDIKRGIRNLLGRE